MVNYDTIAGGDIVYVHSAHLTWPSTTVPDPASRYSFDPKVRDRLLAISQADRRPLRHPPQLRRLPEGTGSWSDHAPFACLGAHRPV